MKKSLCLPKFCMLTSGKLGKEEESKLHILYVQTLPLSPVSQQNLAGPSCPDRSSFSVYGIS